MAVYLSGKENSMPLTICSYEQYKQKQQFVSLRGYREERKQVIEIVEEVRQNQDAALIKFAREFDSVELAQLAVSLEEINEAYRLVGSELVELIQEAKNNIERFHHHQKEQGWWDSGPGWILGQRYQPLQSVGAYIPGGTAAYPSSVLMTVVPARVAGVENIYICTPPDNEGKVNPLTLVAAREAGAAAVFKSGGAQAVAAMTYGTETIPPVQKIVGPGNIYVTLAKKEVYGEVGIDMLAGPSEIVIVASDGAEPSYIAADLLSQAEHDPLSRSILITTSEKAGRLVIRELEEQLKSLPRKKVAEKSLKQQGAVISVPSITEAWKVVNELAPEHLELHLEDAWQYLDFIESAGAVFIGPYSPEALGDYFAGSNHVLPTGTAARFASALGVYDFIKRSNVLYYTAEALQSVAPQIVQLARSEGLEAHARSVLLRGENDEPPDEN
ncbi:MAG: histidinol dehydrogenase [Bacillota bacterium]